MFAALEAVPQPLGKTNRGGMLSEYPIVKMHGCTYRRASSGLATHTLLCQWCHLLKQIVQRSHGT